jgi:hypothetical protein
MALLQFAEQREPRFARHADIGHDDLGFAVLQSLADLVDRRKRLVSDAFTCKRFFQHPANGTVVVNDPYRVHRLALEKIAIVIGMHGYIRNLGARPVEFQR